MPLGILANALLPLGLDLTFKIAPQPVGIQGLPIPDPYRLPGSWVLWLVDPVVQRRLPELALLRGLGFRQFIEKLPRHFF